MRKIKFRAWDKKNKKMAYSDDGNQEYGWFTGNDGCMLCVRIEEEKDIKLNNIMQYVGFKDKNGKEIYEGDILEVVNNLNEATKKFNTNVMVKYKEGSFVAAWEDEIEGEFFNNFNSYNTPIVTFEIIGNIYETKEIFKKIKDNAEKIWVKCSKCEFGGNGDNSCKYGKDVKRCAEDIGCCTTGVPIKK